MKFLEAKKVLSAFEGGPEVRFLLGLSGQPEPLDLFVRACAARSGRTAVHRVLPFNTLRQTLLQPPEPDEIEVFLLMPWDLLPEADWRSGIPETTDPASWRSSAEATAALLRRRPNARIIYVDGPLPPLSPNTHLNRALRPELRAVATALGATVLDEHVVSFRGLLDHGSAIAPAHLGEVAQHVVECALRVAPEPTKVVVTDFDNTLWHGVVGEDGPDGVEFGPEGVGFPHFIFQSYLRALKAQGVLLAGVTKNDPDLAVAPLAASGSTLRADDFIAIVASYNPKSAQLAELSDRLNLGLESFVFVDDNPVEIAEVSGALPAVTTVQFPSSASGLVELMAQISSAFHRSQVTAEDRDRTGMYRRMLDGMVPQQVAGSDVTAFLADLDMKLTIHDRSTGDRARAVQLINKTNQFNLNGVRRQDTEVEATLAAGGRLITASLQDRHGSHGEILACLIDEMDVVRSFVMSCRVFQRRVEFAFLVRLAPALPDVVRFDFAPTDRNEPMRRFLQDPAFSSDEAGWSADLTSFVKRHAEVVSLFSIDPLAASAELAQASPAGE